MKKLPLEKRVQILSMLVEGSSMRSVSRVCDVSINTVTKLLVDAGQACEDFHNRTVHGLKTKSLQCDELWAFCYAKKRTVKQMPEGEFNAEAGDIWTFTALDRDSKMMVSWFSGDRDTDTAASFLRDTAGRISEPGVQVTTDGWPGYKDLISELFPLEASYGQVQKVFSTPHEKGPARRYSPGVCVSAERKTIFGNTDYSKITTSHVERMNLNIRTGVRRFTRLTNAFSKKLENHAYALALYFVHYNFARIHNTLRTSPAQAAGITDELLSMEDIVRMVDDFHRPEPVFRVVPAKDGSFTVAMDANAYAPKRVKHGFPSQEAAENWIAASGDAWFSELADRHIERV